MFLPLVVFSVTAAQPDKAVWSKTVRYGRSRSFKVIAIGSNRKLRRHAYRRKTDGSRQRSPNKIYSFVGRFRWRTVLSVGTRRTY